MTIWTISVCRRDPATTEAVWSEPVMTFDDVSNPHTLGGTMMALAYTTSVEASQNGDAFDFIMRRNDPYTEAFISDTVILEGFVEDPDARWPTVESMRQVLRDNIVYVPEPQPE